MIRFDMSEYMEKHSVAKLVGAPPGYVGYEEAGQLTERVRRNPYSLILLDEVEKAHPDVMHMFLQVLDDGRLTDGQGRTVSFKDTIIIMTSNAGTGKVEANVGFGAAREGRTNSVLGELGNFFSPEFMNRFDGIIEFKSLDKENLLKIVDLMLEDVNERLATNDIHLDVTDKVKEKLVNLGYDPKMGARPLRRTIQDHIEDAITDYYLEHPSEKELKAVMTSNGKIVIKSAKKAENEAGKDCISKLSLVSLERCDFYCSNKFHDDMLYSVLTHFLDRKHPFSRRSVAHRQMVLHEALQRCFLRLFVQSESHYKTDLVFSLLLLRELFQLFHL